MYEIEIPVFPFEEEERVSDNTFLTTMMTQEQSDSMINSTGGTKNFASKDQLGKSRPGSDHGNSDVSTTVPSSIGSKKTKKRSKPTVDSEPRITIADLKGKWIHSHPSIGYVFVDPKEKMQVKLGASTTRLPLVQKEDTVGLSGWTAVPKKSNNSKIVWVSDLNPTGAVITWSYEGDEDAVNDPLFAKRAGVEEVEAPMPKRRKIPVAEPEGALLIVNPVSNVGKKSSRNSIGSDDVVVPDFGFAKRKMEEAQLRVDEEARKADEAARKAELSKRTSSTSPAAAAEQDTSKYDAIVLRLQSSIDDMPREELEQNVAFLKNFNVTLDMLKRDKIGKILNEHSANMDKEDALRVLILGLIRKWRNAFRAQK